jgi:hypothetical protein
VVIESDDWGSIRMPNSETINKLKNAGIDLLSDEGARFNRYDSLATSQDLGLLFELLNSIKDSTGRPVVITPVSVVANPNFDLIYESGFKKYFYEPFTETLKSYPGCAESYSLWKEGIAKRLFVPQFHGREHLNVQVWMRALQTGHKHTREAFNSGMWGISTANDSDIRLELQAAFDFIESGDLEYQKEVISTGLDLFEELFGYQATHFVPPNGPFSKKLEKVCSNAGIRYLSRSKFQKEPIGMGHSRRKLYWLGKKGKNKLIYLTRNCFFEPSDEGKDWVKSCMAEIASAFKWYKPAIISSHRVNFIGALESNNRDNGLAQLETLLKDVMRVWPDTEFVTSEELGRIIENEK